MSEEKEKQFFTKEEVELLLAEKRTKSDEKLQKHIREREETQKNLTKAEERLKKLGFVKELTWKHVHFNPNTMKITVSEYDFYVDRDAICTTCGTSEFAWLYVCHNTVTSTCALCRQTKMLGIMKRTPARRYKVDVYKAEEIMRSQGMSTEDIKHLYKWVFTLKDRLEKAKRLARPRPRPKKSE